MKVGFVGFGEVASELSRGLIDEGVNVLTCVDGRSSKTQKLAKQSGAKLCLRNRDVAEEADILISSVTPEMAISVAYELGKLSKGIYVDINNVSPETVKKSLSLVENHKVVDAAIIGSVHKKGHKVQIIASGNSAEDFSKLNDFGFNIKIVGSEIGQASAIKMLRSSYTKGVSMILWETVFAAYKLGLDKEVLNIIAETEGPNFEESAKSRLISSAFHSKRRSEEIIEVKDFLSQINESLMVQSTENIFELIFKRLGKLDERPANYQEIFKLFDLENK
ncbi:NAD(P)-dependent oxidoreductase [Methanobacterium alcaliphilum]|uniref:NAD(P)-dependent oxidoreductase n=1 Tax=Methanobacterium alcaliphilum TaxID=392018 RepID=UPI00200AABF6|nr:NAD(P)-dependent oxidoreductase [Methanobacterium alcaliphilum]MCK9152141.1 NAD(P)-binding domain-containing protein [Methanobacterium alcaliphilum]